MRKVVAHYEGTPKTGMLAMAMTNLAIILIKAATIDERRDRIQEAVGLCRRALPLRPKAEDPLGWAFSAVNLALALRRLGADDAAARRSHLKQAAAVSQEAADILDAHGNVWQADQARINRLDALLGVADQLREQRLRIAIGANANDEVSRAMIAELLELNPAVFGLTETPPAVAEIVRGPARPDEARILKTVLDESAALLAEPRVARSPVIRSRLARLRVMTLEKLLGPTQEAADMIATERRLIDEIVAPDAAAETDGLLGSLFADLGRWAQAAEFLDDGLAISERVLSENMDRDRAAPWSVFGCRRQSSSHLASHASVSAAVKVFTTLTRPSRIVRISSPRAIGLPGGPIRHASAAVSFKTYRGPSSSNTKPARRPSRSF